MRRALAIALGAALAAAAPPPPVWATPSHARWMGEASCSAWPHDQAYDDFDKALLLNWVLGWLSRSGKDGADVLAGADQRSVSSWLDRYCAAHPSDTLLAAAAVLEGELAEKGLLSRL